MAVLRGAAGWIIRQAAAMQAAAGGRRWRACPPRWRRWRLRCCCEVWQGWQAVGAVQVAALALVRGHRGRRSAAGVVIWCGAGGADPSRCRWFAQYPGTAPSAPRVLSSFSPGRPPATPSACRSADPAGRAGGRAGRWAKEKGQGGGAWCAAALAFCLHWRCDLLRRVRPGAYRGRWWSAPRSGAGLLALALFRVQRFQLATFQHGTACAGGAPSGAFLPFAGGVRFSTLPGSALGVGLELSEL